MEQERLREFTRLLDALCTLQGELAGVLQSKLEAMRGADLPAMQRLGEREAALVQRIEERNGLRKQLMDAMAQGCQLPAGAGRTMTISQICARLSGESRDGLIRVADRLRDAVDLVGRTNAIVAIVARELVDHLKWVFASVRPVDEHPTGYAGDGVVVTARSAGIFEMMG